MRKIYALLLIAVFGFVAGSMAQSTANYTFTTNATGSLALDANGNTVDMSTGTTNCLATQTSQDQAISAAAIPLGFTFYFGATPFTSFFATSNGLLQLGSAAVITGSIYTAAGGTLAAPRFSAFNGDLGTGTAGGIFGKSVGTFPNRCYVVEFRNMNLMWDTYTNNGTWQIRFYESTGVVEYIYGAMAINTIAVASDATPEVGFSWGASANQVLSVTNINSGSLTNASVDRSTTALVQTTVTAASNVLNLNSAANGSRRVLTFTPPTAPAGPSTINVTGVSTTGMTLNWNAASPTTGIINYLVQISTDNVNFVSAANVTLGTNSYTATGLIPGFTYYWKVVSTSEGTVSATSANFTQATTAPPSYTWNQTGTADFTVATNWTPTRTTPATTDKLIFNNITSTVTNIPTQTIGQLEFSTNANVQFQTSLAAILTTSVLTINSGCTLNMNSSTTLGLTLASGGVGAIAGTFTLSNTFATYTTTGNTAVAGTGIINNSGVISGGTTTTLNFAAAAVYNHLRDGGTIPTATYNATSIVNVTNIVATAPSFSGSVGTFNWNCPSQVVAASLASTLTSATGSVTITSTGIGSFQWGAAPTVTITGLFTIGGSANYLNAGTITCNGGFTMNSGAILSGASAGSHIIGTGTNLTLNAGSNITTSSAQTFTMNGTGAQNATMACNISGLVNLTIAATSNTTLVGAGINVTLNLLTVTGGGSLATSAGQTLTVNGVATFGTTTLNGTLSGAGNLAVSASGSLVVNGTGAAIQSGGSAVGVSGTVSVASGNITLSGTSGATAQTFGANFPTPLTIGTVTLNNATAGGAFTVDKTVTLNNFTLTASPGFTTINSGITLTVNGTTIITPATAGIMVVTGTFTQGFVSGITSLITFNSTATMTGAGTFNLNSGATLSTANTAGITPSGATGSVQTTTRNFNTGGNYTFTGGATGTGMPATVSGNVTISTLTCAIGASHTFNGLFTTTVSLTIATGITATIGTTGIATHSSGTTVTGLGSYVTLSGATLNIATASATAGNGLFPSAASGSGLFQPTGLTINAGTNINYNGVTVGVPLGNRCPATFASLTVSNIGSLTFGAAYSVTNLSFTSTGLINTTAANLLTVTGTAANSVIRTTTSATGGFVVGPLARTFTASLSGGTYLYPIGKVTTYEGFELINPVFGAGGSYTILMESFLTAPTGGTVSAPLTGSPAAFYWQATVSGAGSLTSVSNIRVTQGTIVSTQKLGQSATVGGAYTSIGGTFTSGTGTTGLLSGLTIGTFTGGRFFCVATGSATGTFAGGSYAVGPTGPYSGYVATYPSITSALAAMAENSALGAAVILELQTDYVSTVEAYPLNVTGVVPTTSVNTVTIRPVAAVSTVINFNPAGGIGSTALWDFNGGKNFIIDGRNGGTGSNRYISINNLANAPALRLINDAQNNIFRYLIFTAANTSTTNGVVLFSTTNVGATSTNGNSTNTIDNCFINANGVSPNGIYASGTASPADNKSNVITNNRVYDFYLDGNASTGINIQGGNTLWSVGTTGNGNNIYQTSTRIPTIAATSLRGITINNTSGNGFSVIGNTIGGSISGIAGSVMNLGSSTQINTLSNFIYGIRLDVGITTATSVQGNFVQNINLFSSATSGNTIYFTGIFANVGLINIGDVALNTIGSITGTGNINFTFRGTGTGAASIVGIIAGNATAYVGGSINNNNIGGFTTSADFGSTFSVAFTGIQLNSTALTVATSVNNNTIGSSSLANNIQHISTAQMPGNQLGIVFTATSLSAAGATVTGNTIANITNATSFAYTNNVIEGIRVSGTAVTTGPLTVSGNTIRNLTTSSTNTNLLSNAVSIAGITSFSSVTGTNAYTISTNIIHSLTNTNNSASVLAVTGLFFNSANTATIVERNFLHSFSTGNNTSASQFGIAMTGASTGATFRNNMVRLGINPAGTSNSVSAQIIGFYKTTATVYNLYFNTVYIGGSSVVGGAVNTAALLKSATTGADVIQNNIFVNQRVRSSGTGKHYGVYYAATTGLTGTNVNFNDIYVQGTGTVFGFNGTSDFSTFGTWKSSTLLDASSVNGDPKFISPTGNSATVDLHINTALPTQIEASGLAIGSITNDFDNDTRASFTPTDMGADAGNFIAQDVTPPGISYTALSNSSCTTTRTLTTFATITDANGVNSLSGTKPRIYYKKSLNANEYNDNTNTTDGWKYAEATNSTSPYSFAIDPSLIAGGIITGDVIQYFVVAQDNSLPTVGITSGLTFTIDPTSVDLTFTAFPINGTLNSYTITAAGLTGTVTIGSAGTYTSLTGAANSLFIAINSLGLTGNVTANLMDATINETGATALNVIGNSGCSAGTYTLTIKPNTTSTLTGTLASGSLIKLNGADNVTIDGSNSGGTDRSLTINNSATTAPTAVSMISLGTGAGATGNIIKNCNINTGTKTSSYGIALGGTNPGSAGDDNDNNTLQNNLITFANIGIFSSASSSGVTDNLLITQNILGSAAVTNSINNNAINLVQANNATISRNEVLGITQTSSFDAISIGAGVTNTRITRNSIHDLINNSTNRAAGIGLATGAAANITIDNNVMYSIINNGTGGVSFPCAGIYTSAGTGFTIYYNAISLTGDRDAVTTTKPTAVSSCIMINNASSGLLDIRNNILLNTQTAATNAPKSYTIYSTAPNTAFTSINYNDYFVSGAQGVLGFLTSDRVDLAGMIAGFGQNANSINADPLFTPISTVVTNPLRPGTGSPVIGAGTTVSVTIDYLGATRGGTPSIGAYESITPNCTAPASPTLLVQGTTGPGSIVETFTPNATAPTGYMVVRYPTGSAVTPPVNGVITYAVGQTLGLGTISNIVAGTVSTFTMSSLAPNTGYDVYVYAYSYSNCVNGPAFGTPLIGINHQTAACPSLTSTITVGAGEDYTYLGDAALILNGCPISQPTTVLLKSATYDPTGEVFPIVFTNNSGANGVDRITIAPESGSILKSLTGTSTSPLLDFSGAKYYTLDGRPGATGITSALTINNLGNGPAIRLFNDAQENVVKYMTLIANNTSVTSGVVRISVAAGSTSISGNNNNTIDNCNIDGNGVSPVGIYAQGSAAPADNKSNVISDNNIYNFYSDAASTPNMGIHLITNNGVSTGAAWTISGNSFYQTSNRTFASNATFYTAIGAGFYSTLSTIPTVPGSYNITNNFIGGNAVSAAGTSTLSATTALAYHGIYLLGLDATNLTTIQNNTVRNMALTTTTGVSSGISAHTGRATITGNTIGNSASANSITYNGTTSGSFIALWNTSATGTGASYSITNNTVAGIGLNTTTVANSFIGIQVGNNATMTGISTVNGNTIGTLAGPVSNSNSASGAMTGILQANTIGANINGNTISYMSLTNATATGSILGINCTAGTATSTIDNNIINNLNTTSTATATTTSAAIAGIQNSAAQASISGNTINALTASANASNTIHGIYNAGSVASANANMIYGLASSNVSATASVMNGFYMNGGSGTYSNNVVRLGTVNPTVANLIHGIYDVTGTNNIYFNSVYVGGSGVLTTVSNSYAFRSTNTGTRIIRNNVFMNARSNGSTGGVHYAVTVAGTTANPTGLTLNNNDYFANGTGGVFGRFNAADVISIAAWKTAVGQDNSSFSANPNFNGPTAAIPDLTINTTPASVLESQATPIAGITADYAGTPRNVTTPDIGAYEFVGISAVPIITANTITPSAIQCVATNRTITVTVTGTVTSVTLNYSFNGVAQTPVNMTNSSGTWSGTITAPTSPTSATVTYSVVADNGSYSATYNNSYADEPLSTASFNSVTSTASNVCAGTSVTLNSNTNANVLKISEVTQNAAGTGGGLSTMPSFLVNDYNLYTTLDMAEITNRGTSSINISGMTLEYWSSTSLYGSVTLPSGITPINSGATVVVVFRTATGTTPDIAGQLYHSSANLDNGSGTAAGMVLKSSTGAIIDVVAWNSYSFPVAAGVNATTYPSLALSTSGIGSIYNNGTSWVASTTTAGLTSSFGSLNPGLTANLFVPTSIEWYNAANVLQTTATNYIISNPTATTTYYAKGYNSSGCSINSNNVTVTVEPVPTLTGVSQTAIACLNASSVTMELAGLPVSNSLSVTYNLNGGAATTKIINSNASGFGYIDVTVGNANDGNTFNVTAIAFTTGALMCSNSFVINNSATIDISGTGPVNPVVANSSVGIDLSSAYTFSATTPSGATGIRWYDSLGALIGATYTLPATSTCVPNISRTYKVEAYNASCVSGRTAATIYTKNVITSDPANGIICSSGGSVDLTANVNGINVNSYAWTGSPLSATNIKTVTANPTTTTVYSVTGTSAVCGAISGTFTVGVIPGSPLVPTATPTAVCADASVQLNSNLSGSNFGVSSTSYAPATAPGSGVTTIVSGGTANITLSGGSLDDGGWGGIPIGFSYNFFGVNNTTLSVGTNGVIGFGIRSSYTTTDLGRYIYTSTGGIVFPNTLNPANIIALFASDLQLGTSGTIRYWNDGIAPTRRFIVEYLNVPQFTNASKTSTVQCILYETTGVVEIHVTNIADGTGNAAPTIGLQNITQTIGATAPGRTAFTTGVSTPEAWRFVPPATYTYAWTPITNLTSSTITNPVFIAGATPGNYTYNIAVTNPNTGCITNADVSFLINPVPTAPSATTAYTYCQNETATALTATPNGSNTLKWYTTYPGTGSSTAITPSTTTPGTITYYVTQVSVPEGCESPATAINVTVNAAPSVPTVTTPLNLCENSTASFLVATGTSGFTLRWYTVATGGTSAPGIIPSTSAPGNTPYYVSQVNPSTTCESGRATLNVVVNALPVAPVVTSPVTYCLSQTASNLSANATALVGHTLKWYASATGGVGSTTAITPTTNIVGAKDYYVSQVNTSTGCEGARAAITVNTNPQPTVVLSASTTSVCSSTSITYTASPSNGGATPSYRWYKNNVLVSGPSTTPTYSVTNAADADNIYVQMTATTCGNAVVNSNHIILTSVDVTPYIAITPSVTNICAGSPVTFTSVINNGGNSPAYRWFINGAVQTGETASTFTTSSIPNNGVVTAELTSSLNTSCITAGQNPKLSSGVSITHKTATGISVHPVSTSKCIGAQAQFSVAAVGTGVLTYQWNFNGTPISGNASATTSVLTINNVGAGNVGSYTVSVTGGCGAAVLSNPATLSLNTVTTISTQPLSQTVCTGSNVTFSVVGSGQGTLSYEWRRNNAAITGNTSSQTPNLILYSAQSGVAGSYTVIVTGACGSVTSNAVTLILNPATVITTQPAANTSQCTNSTIALSASASGSGTITYQWKYGSANLSNGGNVSGAQSPSLSITNATSANTGFYSVVVTAACGSATSLSAYVSINTATAITTQPVGATVCAEGTYSMSVIATGANLTYQWRKGTTPISGATNRVYTISPIQLTDAGSYNVVVTGTCGAVTSGNAILNIGGNTWTGSYSTAWGDVRNWCSGTIPTATSDISIPVTANNPLISSNALCRNIDIATGATVTMSNSTLTVNGVVTGTGQFGGVSVAGLTLAANGNVGTLYFAPSGMGSLKLTGTGASATLGNVTNIYNELNIGSATLTTGNNLVLKSNVNGTSWVAPITGGGTITGDVKVERYISQNAFRAWRMLSVPVQGTKTFKQTWQDNQTSMPGGTAVAGVGTLLTNTTGLGGYDAATSGNSLLSFNNGAPGTFTSVSSTNNVMQTTSGYFVYIRGDRFAQIQAGSANPSPTTLYTIGSLYMGSQPSITLPAGQNVMVGNVYAAPIDFASTGVVKTNINSFKVWDPKLYGTSNVGAYQTFSSVNGYDPTPGGGSYGSTPNSRIESGLAFIVSSGSGGSIQLTEAAKTTGSRSVFRTSSTPIQQFKTNLIAINATNGNQLADGNSVVFDDKYSNAADEADVVKANNFGENLGLVSNGRLMVIEGRKQIVSEDTIRFNLTNLKKQEYSFEFMPKNMDANVVAYLEDRYTGSRTALSMAVVSNVSFTVTNDAKSSATDRFIVVFKNKAGVPVTAISMKAYEKSNKVQVDWKVNAERSISRYEVEHSTDGSTFAKVGSQTAIANGNPELNYSWMHEQPLRGDNYYRVKSINNNGEFKFTAIDKVTIGKSGNGFNIYPNPIVNNRVNLQFINQTSGNYTVVVLNKEGKTIYSSKLSHEGGTATRVIQMPSSIAAGTYQLEIISADGKIATQNLVISNK